MRVCVGVGGGGGGGAEGAPQLVLEEKDLQDRTAAPQLHTFHPRYAGKEMCGYTHPTYHRDYHTVAIQTQHVKIERNSGLPATRAATTPSGTPSRYPDFIKNSKSSRVA